MTASRIQIVEPFFTGSHQQWAKGWQQHSQHQVDILSLPGRHWKWRMYGGAVTLAQRFLQQKSLPDLLVLSDMLDATTFLALTRERTINIPVVIYFHENQITYPWSPTDADVKLKRNNQYGFLNYTSALSADQLWFNSAYHQCSFLTALPKFLKQFPDYQGIENVKKLTTKSTVLYLGMDLKRFLPFQKENNNVNDVPVILWNHRWEYDKNPQVFFETLLQLKSENISFQLIVLGESYHKQPPIFKIAHEQLADRILHFGYALDFATYARLLWQADILPVTSHQDFFGGSIVEAIFCNNFPLLPNRLAYPEHIPANFHDQYLYEDKTDLYHRLKDFLIQFPANRGATTRQNFVIGYDWSTLAEEYDSRVAAIVGGKR
ncbi:MAG: DUF3524 domain-containing protein [Saprospiraceae bacterium]